MGKPYSLGTAKKSSDLAAAYNKAKSEAKQFGLDVSTNLKEEVVATAMDQKKKPAEFYIDIDTVPGMIKLDFVCEVAGGVKSVLGRKAIKSVEEYKKMASLAKLVHQKTVEKECHWDV